MGKLLIIQPRDTLFFRGGEPFNAGETLFIKSQFPPAPQVMQGFIRSFLLSLHGANWDDYAHGFCSACGTDQCPVLHKVGAAGSLSISLGIRGPFIVRLKSGKCDSYLYPLPLDLACDNSGTLKALRPGKPILSDIGLVRFTEANGAGLKLLKGMWIDEDALYRYLRNDKIPELSSITCSLATRENDLQGHLVEGYGQAGNNQGQRFIGYHEPYLGIAVDHKRGSVIEGLLYSVFHFRFYEAIEETYALAVALQDIPEMLTLADEDYAYSLGGERRQVYVKITDYRPFPAKGLAETIDRYSGNFRMMLLQPALFKSGWLPDGFVKHSTDRGITWRGRLNGIECELVSASVGKPVSIGGWNIKAGVSRPLYSMVPAASVYYFITSAKGEQVVRALHNKNIGHYADLGYGHVIVGGWLDNVI